MPFKSEKQRRFLWAEHPDIAKRWAHEYPKSHKNLPMYADKQKPETAETSNSKEKAATFNIAEIAGQYVDKRINHTINIANTGAETIAKTADSKQEQVDIPHSAKPTYAGEEREKGEIDTEIPDDKNISGTNSAPSQNAINDLLTKFSVVLSPHIEQTMENMTAEREGRVARRIPRNRGLKRYSVAAPSIPLPYGMAQNQPQPQQSQPQSQQSMRPVGGGSNPMFNPINAFGAISATGVINGNAAFGQKNSPDSSKTASICYDNNSGLAKVTSMDFPMQPDPEDLEIEDDERTKQANIFLKALPFLARMGRGAATAGNVAARSSLPNVVIRLGAKSAPVERFLAHYMHSIRRMDSLAKAGVPIPKDISKVVQFGNTFINGTRPSLAKMSPEIQTALRGAFQQAHLGGLGMKADVAPEVAKHLKALAGRYSVAPSQLRGWGNYRMTAGGTPELLPPALAKPDWLARTERWVDAFGKGPPSLVSPPAASRSKTIIGQFPPAAGGVHEDRWSGYFKDSSDHADHADKDKPCSCGCGDTVETCKCSSSCSCKQPGGSCYQKPKEKDADMVKYSLEDMLKSARCWAGYEPVPGKKPFSEDSCRPVGSGKKKKKKEESKSEKEAGTPAWQRSEGKNEEGGLNAKGRASYKAQTGGTLKAPVTESNPKGKRAKRQNSFCSRMCGMKRVNTGAKTKSDPDSRINKSLRKWNCKCSSAMTFGAVLASREL